jgi:hypothetical protein
MKQLIILLLFFSFVQLNVIAQAPNPAVNKEKMSVFAPWVGNWQGEGSMQMGPGAAKKSSVDEKIELKLDGTILVVEGVGKSEGSIVHNAFGILSYDPMSSQYKFKTYVKEGRTADAWFTVLGDNKYQWGFDVPNGGKVRYSITIDGKKWNEIGEFSRDGNTYMKTFEMNLTKVE